MVKLRICRFRNSLIHYLCTSERKGLRWKFVQAIYALCLLFITIAVVLYENYIYKIRELHQVGMNRSMAVILGQKVPKVKDVDCNVFVNSSDSWNESLQHLSETNITEEAFIYTNCSAFLAQWFTISTTVYEDEFPIAFSVIVYSDISRFVRLLRAVYRPSNVYCVHVDQKSSDEFKANVRTVTSCLRNVFQPPDPISIWWGSKEVLMAEMVCLRALWKHQVKWLAFINLTGEEFPLKTNLELVKILHIMGGRNDVWLDPCTLDGPGDRTTKVCMDLTKEGFAERWKGTSPAPHNVHPYKGQIHVVLFRAAVDYILHNVAALDLYNWVLQTFIPDELFFSTLNSNPHLGVPGSNPNPSIRRASIARVKLWWSRDTSVWRHCSKYLRAVCLLTARELPLLIRSRQLFANKFKSSYRPLGYSCLEQWYYERVLAELKTGRSQLDYGEYYRIYNNTAV